MKAQRFQLLFAVLGAFLWLTTMPVAAQYTLAPSFIFATNNDAITITGYTAPAYTGPGGNVDIPDSTNGYPVTGISSNAFMNCNPTSLTIPASITNIGEGAFGFCPYLTNIAVAVANPSYTNVGGSLFDKSLTLLLQYPAGLAADSFIIPDSITRIGASAFSGCAELANVTIPNSVTSIGASAFFYCYGLTNIAIPNGITSIDSYMFMNSGLTSVTLPNSVTNIGQEAFTACSSLTNVTLGNRVTSIGVGAFYSSGLTAITLPSSVTNIDAWAFWNCSSLTDIYFLGHAPMADSSAFSGDNLATVYYLPKTTGWDVFFNVTGVPIVLWLPQVPMDASFGLLANQFGFTISWASGQTVVVDTCTNLFNPDWQPVQTNTLSTGAAAFSDPQWTNYPHRFYRLRSP